MENISYQIEAISIGMRDITAAQGRKKEKEKINFKK